jgi:hypothetical protein
VPKAVVIPRRRPGKKGHYLSPLFLIGSVFGCFAGQPAGLAFMIHVPVLTMPSPC